MSKNDTKARVDKALIDYYSMNDSSMSDEEFDTLFDKVYPGKNPFDIYSQIFVGRGRRRELKKPMLSLAKATNINHLGSWLKDMKKSGYSYVTIVPKFDGAACLIETDSKGDVISAITRGDGKIGQDITYVVSNIPHKEDLPKDSLIQTEVTLENDKLKEASKLSTDNGGKEYSSPRNVAAGLIRKTGENARKGAEMLSIHQHFSKGEEGEVVNIKKTSPQEILKKINLMHSNVLTDKLHVNTDGVVIYVSDSDGKPNDSLGNKEKTPKWSIAWKFPDEPVEAILKDVIWNHNRTKNTPVAIFKQAVKIEGSMVSRATLHNSDFIEDMDIKIGDTLQVVLANKIIPKIVGVKKAEESKRISISIPSSSNNESTYFSYAKTVFDSLDIENAGDKTVEIFSQYAANNGSGNKPIPDIFSEMKRIINRDNILEIEEFVTKKGDINKSVEIFRKNIESVLTTNSSATKEQVLQSTCTPTVGKVISRKIFQKYSVKDFLNKLNNKSLQSSDGIGEKTVESLIMNKENISLVFDSYFPWLVDDNVQKEVSEGKLSGKKIVITGKFDISRGEIQKIIESFGGELSGSVNKETDMVITPDKSSSSSKITKAEKLNINIVETDDITEYINNI